MGGKIGKSRFWHMRALSSDDFCFYWFDEVQSKTQVHFVVCYAVISSVAYSAHSDVVFVWRFRNSYEVNVILFWSTICMEWMHRFIWFAVPEWTVPYAVQRLPRMRWDMQRGFTWKFDGFCGRFLFVEGGWIQNPVNYGLWRSCCRKQKCNLPG